MSEPTAKLTFDDAVFIANGCFDYSGGYDEGRLEIFHHGIQTVVNALTAAQKSGLDDSQCAALWKMGKAKPNTLAETLAQHNQKAPNRSFQK